MNIILRGAEIDKHINATISRRLRESAEDDPGHDEGVVTSKPPKSKKYEARISSWKESVLSDGDNWHTRMARRWSESNRKSGDKSALQRH